MPDVVVPKGNRIVTGSHFYVWNVVWREVSFWVSIYIPPIFQEQLDGIFKVQKLLSYGKYFRHWLAQREPELEKRVQMVFETNAFFRIWVVFRAKPPSRLGHQTFSHLTLDPREFESSPFPRNDLRTADLHLFDDLARPDKMQVPTCYKPWRTD